MLTGASLRDPIFINTVGHTTGLLLFGLTILLLIRDHRAHGVRRTRLSICAAALAFVWNAGSLVALINFRHEPSVGVGIVMAAGFSALSLLPAVLLQLALKGTLRAIVAVGYAISGLAICLHIGELFSTSSMPHQIALILVAIGFGILTAVGFFWRSGRTRYWERAAQQWLPFASLLLFTSSFPHFGYRHVGSPWAAEIAWHHIGIPVVLTVLLQDYRFLLLDTFVRFLMNSLLAAGYISCIAILNHRWQIDTLVKSNQVGAGLVLVALGLSLMAFSQLKNALQGWISRVIFHRQNVDERIRRIVELPAKAQTEEILLSEAAKEVAEHFRADQFAIIPGVKFTASSDQPTILWGGEESKNIRALYGWAEASVPLCFPNAESRDLLLGARVGRQRYLSEDLEDMRRLSSAIVEQAERFRSDELKQLAVKAELRALQAQINPHFLFNALNTLYGTIDRGSQEARRIVLNLAEIFRYFLQGDRPLIPLSEELRIVQAYLEIESLRLGDRLRTELHISEAAKSVMLPALLIQPLVENAVKHGVAANPGAGKVSLRAETEGGKLLVTIEDSGGGFVEGHVSNGGSGTGLENVRRRLKLSYGAEATLDIRSSTAGSRVSFQIPRTAQESRVHRPFVGV